MAWYKGFFATRNDLTPGILRLEEKWLLTYIEERPWPSPRYEELGSALEIPDLGYQRADGVGYGRTYLVLPRRQRAKARSVHLFSGETDFRTDSQSNPEAVMLHPGGIHPSGALLGGYITVAERKPTQ